MKKKNALKIDSEFKLLNIFIHKSADTKMMAWT
jgi:hypothetical protein